MDIHFTDSLNKSSLAATKQLYYVGSVSVMATNFDYGPGYSY